MNDVHSRSLISVKLINEANANVQFRRTLLPELVDFSTQKAKNTIVRENLNFFRAEKCCSDSRLLPQFWQLLLGHWWPAPIRQFSESSADVAASVNETVATNIETRV